MCLGNYQNQHLPTHFTDEPYFKTTSVEVIGKTASEPQLCAQLSTGQEPVPLNFDGPTWMTREDVSKKFGETGIVGAKKIDIANDGKPINVGKFELSSGAGAGCDEVFFDQVDSNGAHFEPGPKRSLLMDLQEADPSDRYPIRPCANKPNFFEYQGRIYFENKPATWPPIDAWDQYHRVARINAGKAEDVCGFTFSTAVAIGTKEPHEEE